MWTFAIIFEVLVLAITLGFLSHAIYKVCIGIVNRKRFETFRKNAVPGKALIDHKGNRVWIFKISDSDIDDFYYTKNIFSEDAHIGDLLDFWLAGYRIEENIS